jgi:hypothetical protein
MGQAISGMLAGFLWYQAWYQTEKNLRNSSNAIVPEKPWKQAGGALQAPRKPTITGSNPFGPAKNPLVIDESCEASQPMDVGLPRFRRPTAAIKA